MTIGKTINENIKKLRTKPGLTQADLAKKAEVEYATLMKAESGAVNKPSIQTMAKIATLIATIVFVAIGTGMFFIFHRSTFPRQSTSTQSEESSTQEKELSPPTVTPPLIYHGVATHGWSTLWGLTGQADAIKAEVDTYEAAVGRAVAWVGFAHEWKTDGRTFPSKVATSIKNRGAMPLIFLNLRSFDVIDETQQQVEPLYTLDAIISGKFDSDLMTWADGAKNFGSEIIVDWGWEMNGEWTLWNGLHNGGTIEGPKRYREAYRHIIELMRNSGATNIRWAFHINYPEYPAESWNAFENYYPGDDVIDIIGASIYTAQAPTDDFFPSFESLMDPAYSRLVKMTPKKPVYVFEFGATAGNPLGSSVTWADNALAGILSGRWPAVRSFAWWNDYWECWCQDGNPAHDTEMRVEKVPGLAAVFKSRLSGAQNVGERPPIFSEVPPRVLTEKPVSNSSLKTLAEQRGIRFGSNYQYEFRGAQYDKNFETEMNAMTAGIFWNDGSHQSRNEFDFSEMDAKVNWGLARGMEVYGQTLVWFDETEMPDWLKALPASAGETVMNGYIDTVVKRYAGKIKFWNVVNEAVNDGDSGTLRQDHIWARAMGDDYIRKAFVRAHAADPNAILYYNEYDIESNKAKFEATKALLLNLKKQGAPVHALGWQMHVKPGSFDQDVLLARMNEIADLGFDNYMTELDVELPESASAEDLEKQKQTFKTVVETALKARRLKSVVVWGIRDGDTWWLTKNHHTLLDEKLNKKPAYFGVQEALE